MKKLARNLLLVGTMVASGVASANFDSFSPVIGIDYQHAWMEGDTTDELFSPRSILKKSYPGGTVYIGGRFCENFGLELGYDWATKAKRDATIVPGDDSFFAGTTFATTTKVQRSGGHLDLQGYLPVAECVELVGSVGIGYVRAKIDFSASVGTTPVFVTSSSNRSSAVARIRGGVNYMLTECVGLRGLVGWESTSSARSTVNGTFAGAPITTVTQRPFRDTVTGSLGLFVKW